MADADELVNVYDADGRVIGARPRREAKASGLAVGAVNALVINGSREVLLQRRLPGKDNGGLWDKSVGGHVGAGEDFDGTLVREAGEELFGDAASPRIALTESVEELTNRVARGEGGERVLLCRVGLQRNLRDVRHGPDGRLRIVLYHVAIYAGRTELPLAAFAPQAAELADLRYFPAAEVDRMLLEGRLAPNMAFLWLTRAQELLRLAG